MFWFGKWSWYVMLIFKEPGLSWDVLFWSDMDLANSDRLVFIKNGILPSKLDSLDLIDLL